MIKRKQKFEQGGDDWDEDEDDIDFEEDFIEDEELASRMSSSDTSLLSTVDANAKTAVYSSSVLPTSPALFSPTPSPPPIPTLLPLPPLTC